MMMMTEVLDEPVEEEVSNIHGAIQPDSPFLFFSVLFCEMADEAH